MSNTDLHEQSDASAEWHGWAKRELGAAGLGDARLDARLVDVASRFLECPQGQIPQASGSWGQTKATYRFFSNPKVNPDIILGRHSCMVAERAREHPVVLAISDTTMLDFTKHVKTEGLGPLADTCHHGLVYHPTLLVTPGRVPLGLIDQQIWTRDWDKHGDRDPQETRRLPIEQKESHKWMCSIRTADCFQHEVGRGTQVVSVFDREGDVFEVLHEVANTTMQIDFLIRSMTDRRVEHKKEEERLLWSQLATADPAGTLTIVVPRKPEQSARSAELTVRYTHVVIKRPKNRPAALGLEPVACFVVSVHEDNPPDGEDPVSWRLLTTLRVESFDDACRIVQYYTCRWLIEMFFRVLKSGCGTELRQLRTAQRLIRATTVDSIVAWRICYLTMLGRQVPDLPCSSVLQEHEWRGLWSFVHRTDDIPIEPPRLHDAIRMLARIGGHLGRKRDGLPGLQTVGRGMQALIFLGGMYLILGPP